MTNARREEGATIPHYNNTQNTDNPKMHGDYSITLNRGKEDEMELCGYCQNSLRSSITYLLIVLTLGILRLVFHWVPHWYLKAKCSPCHISQATYVLITELYNAKHKIYHVEKLHTLTPESIRKMRKKDNLLINNMNINHEAEEEEERQGLSVHFEHGIFRELTSLLLFSCKKVTYVWDEDKREFIKLMGLDHGVSSEVLHRAKPLSKSEQFMRRMVYGNNEITVPETSIMRLLFLEVLNPFYVFQLFSFILWFSDNYYYYAAAILLMSIFGISMTVKQTRKNQRNLKSTVHTSDLCGVVRSVKNSKSICGAGEGERPSSITEVISTENLVPGDILEIPPHGCIMQCDALLLTGNCIVNEAMLTGESVPITKTPFPNIPNLFYDPKEHAKHTLFCGTQIIQTRYFGNEKVLAIVIRTGFATAKGGLVRSILYPPPVDFRFEKDSYRFVALLGLIAGLGFVYTIITKVLKGIAASELIVEALDLITIVVPPALPAAMTVGRYYAQKRLKANQIFCISPRSINVSGSIDCVCFDKTGTLTEDGLDLLCVVPISNKYFTTPIKNVSSLPYNTFLCGLVSCHSLTIIDKQITGDPLDLKMFESTSWTMEEHDTSDNTKFDMIFPTVLKPPKSYSSSPARPPSFVGGEGEGQEEDMQIAIIREFPFSSSAQRMGVIIRKLSGTNFEYYCKGSPEMLLTFVKPETVPEDFSDILENYTQEGYRVIAVAHKVLKLSYPKVQKVQREALEKDLTLLGLIVMENRLKPDTTPCIQILNEAKMKIVMVTGDNILTAISVARDCKIITQSQSVINVNVDNSNPPQVYYTLANSKQSSGQPDMSLLTNSQSIMSLDTVESQTVTNSITHEREIITHSSSMYNNYRFAVTGKVWAVVKEHYPELIPKLITRGSIFARMSPEQKQQLVQDLQSLGYYVAMCGDGANDCGALKAAHTGISLSEAESSVASPFTSKNPDIRCVLNIVKEGRAALVTSFGIFKYMASYSLCQFISVLILYSIESNLTDIEFLYIDLFMISIFAFFFGRTEAYSGKLVKDTPLNSLISVSPILSLVLQLFWIIVFQIIAFEHVTHMNWYVPFHPEDENALACVENYVIFTVSSFQYVILAIVFSKGAPYRRSVFSNYGFILSAILVTAFSIYLAIYPAEFLINLFDLVVPESMEFRVILLGYAFVNFVVAIITEVFIVDKLVFKKLRFKFHNVDKSKRKYLAIERDLNKDTKWPTLTSVKSTASPLTPLPICTAEIVVESECKFEPNHVLNKLFEDTHETQQTSLEFLTQTQTNSIYSTPSNSAQHFINNHDKNVNQEEEEEDDEEETYQSISPLPMNSPSKSISINLEDTFFNSSSPFKTLNENGGGSFLSVVANNEQMPNGSPHQNVSSFNAFGRSPTSSSSCPSSNNKKQKPKIENIDLTKISSSSLTSSPPSKTTNMELSDLKNDNENNR